MKSTLRVSSLIALTFLLLFSSVTPYIYVSAEEPDTSTTEERSGKVV